MNIGTKYNILINEAFEKIEPIKKDVINKKKYFTEWQIIKNLNNINLTKLKKNEEIEFITNLFKNLANNISKQPYTNYDYFYDGNIFRKNHGLLNHLRSIFMCIELLNIFKQNNENLYNEIFNNKNYIIAILVSSYCIALLRTDESGSPNELYSIKDKKWFIKNFEEILIYPDLLDTTFYLHDLASSILLKILLEYIDIKLNDKNIISFCPLFFYNKKFYKIFYLNKLNNNFNLKKLYLFYSIPLFGHTSDHFRGGFSNIFYEDYINKLFEILNITTEQEKYLLEKQIHLLNITEYKSKIIIKNINNCISYKNRFKPSNKMKKCAPSRKFRSKERFKNKNFINLSNNFEKAYCYLDLDNKLEILFETYTKYIIILKPDNTFYNGFNKIKNIDFNSPMFLSNDINYTMSYASKQFNILKNKYELKLIDLCSLDFYNTLSCKKNIKIIIKNEICYYSLKDLYSIIYGYGIDKTLFNDADDIMNERNKGTQYYEFLKIAESFGDFESRINIINNLRKMIDVPIIKNKFEFNRINYRKIDLLFNKNLYNHYKNYNVDGIYVKQLNSDYYAIFENNKYEFIVKPEYYLFNLHKLKSVKIIRNKNQIKKISKILNNKNQYYILSVKKNKSIKVRITKKNSPKILSKFNRKSNSH